MSDALGPVHIVGAGLVGTSIGLALRRAGVPVTLADRNPEHLQIAVSLGAGIAAPAPAEVALTVVAVPPDLVAEVSAAALAGPGFVTDVASVKSGPLEHLSGLVDAAALARYAGGHPMAGTQHSGPLTASAALFEGRPWAITAHPGSDPAAIAAVTALAEVCGAAPIAMTPAEHDNAVALTSHVPHLLASLAAAQLANGTAEQVSMSGPGVRDVTRIAAGDPQLYSQIIRANADAVGDLLRQIRADLDQVIDAVTAEEPAGLVDFLSRAGRGTKAIPPKHGAASLVTASVHVSVPDTPGELARLFADVSDIGVNIEDVYISHDQARPAGLVELLVPESAAAGLADELTEHGWTVHL